MRYGIHKAELNLSEYELFPSNFPTGAKRGIILYVKEELNATEIEINSKFDESVWVKLPLLKNDYLLCGCIYKSTSSDEEKHKVLNDFLCKACTLGHNFTHTLITGDFNFPDIEWTNWLAKTDCSTDFLECLRDNYLCQLIDKPTRVRLNQDSSMLDLLLVNDSNNVSSIEYLDPLGTSDHCVLKFEYMCYFEYETNTTVRYNYYKADYEGLRNQLNIDWENELGGKDTNQMLSTFMNKFNNEVERLVPKSKSRSSKGNLSLSKETLRNIRRKHRLWDRYMEKRNEESYREFCKARNKVKKLTRKERK